MGELDFVISDLNGVVPIEVKSGKDYERHNALSNVLACKDYDIEKAYVLCNGNIRRSGRVIYAPVYMTMFIRRQTDCGGVFQVDLSGLV